MSNNFQRLKDEADIESVINALGIPVFGRGKNKFIHCPLPEHNDKNPTNCFFQPGWNNVYCKRCGRAIKAIDLIMYHAGLEYGQAADMLWDIEGRPNWYYEKRNQKDAKPVFAISGEEAKLLGICLPHSVEVPVSFSEQKPRKNLGETLYAEDQGWIVSKRVSVGWQDFMDEASFKEFILRRCEEKLKIFDSIDEGFVKQGVSIQGGMFAAQRRVISSVKERCIA